MKSDLPERTFKFAVRIAKLWKRLTKRGGLPRRMLDQVVAAGTSVGAHVEEGVASESLADYIHKYSIALKEARETLFWLRVFVASGLVPREELGDLIDENDEIVSILTTTVKDLKKKRGGSTSGKTSTG